MLRQSTVGAENKMQLFIFIKVVLAKIFFNSSDQVTFMCKHWYEARHWKPTVITLSILPLHRYQ